MEPICQFKDLLNTLNRFLEARNQIDLDSGLILICWFRQPAVQQSSPSLVKSHAIVQSDDESPPQLDGIRLDTKLGAGKALTRPPICCPSSRFNDAISYIRRRATRRGQRFESKSTNLNDLSPAT